MHDAEWRSCMRLPVISMEGRNGRHSRRTSKGPLCNPMIQIYGQVFWLVQYQPIRTDRQ